MDTIANLLTIIRNGYLVKKDKVAAPFSKFAKNILDILVGGQYLEGFEIVSTGKFKQFDIFLKYHNRRPAITGIVKVSKPGRRVYRGKKRIPASLSGLGITIVSTSAGVMTEKVARNKKLGGEIICQVW